MIKSHLRYLDSLQASGIRPGLERVKRLLELSGSPHRRYPSIIVAGTNGKGSTASTLASILSASGYRTGLYTSPHLVDLCERWVIDGKAIGERDLSAAVSAFRKSAAVCEFAPTYFEALTVIAFIAFAFAECEVAVMEVGMGGRLDATNVVKPLASVITPIGIDHTEFLGETIEAIASEKAGIIHAGSIAVTSNRDPRVLSVLADRANSAGTSLHRTTAEVAATNVSSRIDGIRFELRTPVASYALESPLAGGHQVDNIALAVRSAELIAPRLKSISQSSIKRGVASVRWRGRLELFHHGGKLVIVDGGHNSHAADAVASFINEHLAPPRTLVFGIMSDKDVQRTAEILFPLFQHIVLTRPDPGRAVSLDALAAIAASMGIAAEGFEKPADAMAHALSLEPNAVVICGSLYLAGAAVALFDRMATKSAAATSDIESAHDSATSV